MSETENKLEFKEEDIPKLVELFKEIQSSTQESNEIINSFINNKDYILSNKFIKEAKALINSTYEELTQKLEKSTEDNINSKGHNELSKLKEENNKLKEEINKKNEEIKNAIEEKKILEEDLKKVNEEKNEMLKNKNILENLRTTYKKELESKDSTIKELKRKIIEGKKEKEEILKNEKQLKSILEIFISLNEKNKTNYDKEYKSLLPKFQNLFSQLNNKYKIFK